MPIVQMPSDFEAIDRLIDAGDLEQSRDLLGSIDSNDESYATLRIKLALRDGSLEPAVAMQKLINLMRRQQDWPGAKELYHEASELAYVKRESSVSLSHVPPSTRTAEPRR